MPELPDVETFKRYLTSTALHQRIDRLSQLDERILEGVSPRTLRRHLLGSELESARRHGKHLFAELSDGRWLILHFGMTGFLRYYESEAPAELEHVRMRLDFAGGYHLAYDCQRLFGYIGLTESPEATIREKDLGPDALAVDAGRFAERIAGKRTSLKSALMDQSTIAGIGNVYSDEIAFHARLDPRLEAAKLDRDQLAALFRATRHVLSGAIEAQADPARMPDTWLTPKRGQDRCPRCGGQLEKLSIHNRTAYMCPSCQKSS